MPRAAVVVIAAAFAAAGGILAAWAGGGGIAVAPLPGPTISLGFLDEPSAVATGPDGSIYVAEAGACRISVFDAAGRRLRRWGAPGSGPGGLRRPGGIAVAPDGRVYVSDTGHQRIVVFSPAGVFESAWGSFGSGSGQFMEPLGLAVDARRVYVADARNNRVQIFDRQGRFELYMWSYGIREGQFDRPVGVAADADGSVYVSDQGNSRIQVFDAGGKFLRMWGGWGPYPGLFAEPGGIAMRDGRLLVADTHNHRAQIFGGKGEILGVWDEAALAGSAGATSPAPAAATKAPRARASFSFFPTAAALRAKGDGIVACDAGADRCVIAASPPAPAHGAEASPITSTARAAALAGSTLIVAAGGSGFLALDVSGSRPSPIGAFGGIGREALQFVRAGGLAIDAPRDAVLVSDAGNFRLAWLDLGRATEGPARYDPSRARFVRSIFLGDDEALLFGPIKWTLQPPLVEPGPLVRDGRGNTFVIDTLYTRIVVFDAEFRPVTSWGARGAGDGSFLEPVDLALDRAGETIHVLDAGTGRVQSFDRAGRALGAWGRLGGGRDGFVRPTSLAEDADGSLLVADRAGRIRRFSPKGVLRGAWGRAGVAPGELDHPDRVLVDASGRVLVLDAGGRRLQAFTRDGDFLWDYDVIAAAAELRRSLAASAAARAASARRDPAAPARASSGTLSDGRDPAAPARASSGTRSDAGAPDATSAVRASSTSSASSAPPGCARRATSNAGRYVVCWNASVDPLPHNAPFTLDVTVYDAAKLDAPAAMVAMMVDGAMPEHGHGLVQMPIVTAVGPSIPKEKLPDHALVHGAAVGNGRFTIGDVRLHMPGRWEIYFDIGRGAVIERAQIEILLD